MDTPNSIHEGSSIYSGLDFSKKFNLVKKFLIENKTQGNHFYIPGRKDHLQIVHEGNKNLHIINSMSNDLPKFVLYLFVSY